ncbi:MAG: DUF1080 domain-containing protein [Pirellulales bacterium]|nr:DUF1080 domain-containing protein [Pirellulales bacterium]
MKRIAIPFLGFIVCGQLAIARADDANDGFQPLFNGKDLTGWVAEGPAGFSVKNGQVVSDGSGDYPTWLRSEEEFENFVLRFEFRLRLYGEGGVFLHAPAHGRNSNVGFEIQLSDDTRNPGPAVISTGAVFAAVPPLKQNSRPLGQWNAMEITFDWPRLKVVLNGETVQDLDVEANPELRDRLRRGYLGLQDRGKPIALRNVRVKRLPDREQWRSLFNGQDFSGWDILEPDDAQWSVENGEILARDGNGYLVTSDQWQDFEFQTYVRSSHFANGGVFFRWKSLVPKDRGNEIQIENIPDSNNPTGSIYDLVRANPLPVADDEWFLLQLRVVGAECRVRVNGVTVATTDKLTIVRPGHIALQMHSRDAWIRFKDPKIKPL